jgi:hypothetical protein
MEILNGKYVQGDTIQVDLATEGDHLVFSKKQPS